jgi:hypothetical protein
MNPMPNDVTEESLFHQAVTQLAHYIYVMRGCKEGRDLNNWIEAETQLKGCLAVTESIDLQACEKIIEA